MALLGFEPRPGFKPKFFPSPGCWWDNRLVHSFYLILIPKLVSVVQLLSHVRLFTTPWTLACQASLSFTMSWTLLKLMSTGCYSTISSLVVPFSSSVQSFLASGSFPVSRLFTSGSQSIGVSALVSVLPMNIQDWFPLRLTGLVSLQFKGLSRVFSNTTVQKHQFFSAEPSLWSNSHILTWLLEKP